MKGPEIAILAFAAATLSLSAAQVYSVPDGERIYPDYAVEVDGAKAPVSAVRCSAMPFNRRWPGHQRQIEQTELCGMVRFAFDGKATVSVTAARDFKTVKIRPLSRGVAFRRDGRTVIFDLVRPGGYSVEFDGLHNNLHVFADAVKEYDLPANALRFGPGEHEIGIRELKSGDTVHLDPGAVVYGGFHASSATNVAILGRGVIDMSRIKEKILFPATGDGHEAVKNAKRVNTIMMRNCRNVRIDGVTIRDSLCYNIGLWGCEDVAIDGVKIIGQWRFNTDGIDLHNCRRAKVSGCFARTYDDTFCFKAHEGYGDCEDCVFERCVAWNDWGKAFEVGVECRARNMRQLTFRDCDCIHAAGWAMDVTNCDYGRVAGVLFDDIRVESDERMPRQQLQRTDKSPFDAKLGIDDPPRLFQAKIKFHHEYSRENGGKWSGGGFIDGVTLRDIAVVTGGRKPQISIAGIDESHRPESVVFEGLAVDGAQALGADAVHLDLGAAAVPPKFYGGGARKLNILCISAHPDDVELCVGGTLLKYRKAGHNIFIAFTTSGNTGSNEMTDTKLIGETREKEALEAAKVYGAKVRFLRNDDERLLDTNETRTQVLDALRWAEPDIVFTHSPNDESPDHAMTSHLVRRMIISMPGVNQQSNEKPCAKKPSVFLWDTGRGIGFVPEVYVDISDEFETKLKALACHKSQFPWMALFGNKEFGESARVRAAFYGLQYGCKYAECFRGWRTSGYIPNFKLLP